MEAILAGMIITIQGKDAQEVQKIAKEKNLSPEKVAQIAIRNLVLNKKLDEAQEVGKKIAKRLGIKSENDVVRMFN